MDLRDILHITVTDKLTIDIEIGFIFVIILIIWVAIFVVRFLKNFKLSYDIELSISLGGIGGVKIKRNSEVVQIAHKAWSELITRKAGLPFDKEHDVIMEVYDSWYQLFRQMRNLIKEIPASQIRNKNTKRLIDVLIESLNRGLRPHLTKWQAKFRRWYKTEVAKQTNIEKSPQEIQRLYPYYNDLIQDLIKINQQLIEYTMEIKKLTE